MQANGNLTVFFAVGIGFYAIAAITWFLSTRRRLFIRVFIPRDEWRDSIRALPKDRDFAAGMRLIATLQFAVAILFGILAAIAFLLA